MTPKPLVKFNPKPLPERKVVTIIAGFKAHGGIVICSDTQETSGPSKRDVPKLRFEQRGVLTSAPLAVAFCGSGYGPLIDKLVDECWKAAEAASDLDGVCGEIENTIKRLYKDYGRIYQPGACPTAELIYGVKTREGCRLFSANHAIVNQRSDYYSSGAGYYMADFLASRMYRQYLSLHQCVILAAYILFQAKEHVDGCGGQSHIAVLNDAGNSGHVDSARIEAMTETLKTFDDEFADLALSAANFDMDDAEIKERAERVLSMLEQCRNIKRDEIARRDKSKDIMFKALGGKSDGETKRDAFGLPIVERSLFDPDF